MNYLKIYNQLVQKRKKIEPTQYFQKHHIKPKSLFPQLINDPKNIVNLTYREHYIAHWLLTKIYPSREMTHAFWGMNRMNKQYVNSHAFQNSRKAFSESMKGQKNPMYGKHLKRSEETKRKISEVHKGKKISEEHKEKLSKFHKGRRLKEETKRKMSLAKKGSMPWNKGKHLTEETKQKIAEYSKNSHWFNDGVKNYRCKECPEGCIPGRIKCQ